MITIADTLDVDHVRLQVSAATPEEAIEEVASLLHDDVRVLDWPRFHAALQAHPPCRVGDEGGFGICIPHARTDAVSEMVMSAGRFEKEVAFSDCSLPVRYVFCIGVPQALAGDYLRIVGALMRLFTNAETERMVHTAATGAEFVAALSRLEMKL
jgi:nitrogen PTS system EIIA component